MQKRLIISLVLLASTAQAEKPCRLGNNYCVPLLACSKDGKVAFDGRAYGKTEGPVTATSKSGQKCQGRWWRTNDGAGKAELACQDGLKARISYTYEHRSSGTVVGEGRLSNGKRMAVWGGHNLFAYLAEQREDSGDLHDCMLLAR